MARSRAAALPLAVLGLAAAVAAGAPVEPEGASAAPPAPPPILLRDVTAAAGITFEHPAAPEKKYILESMSGGVALFDFDGDERLDVYFVNSLTVATAGEPDSAPSALYRNRGDGTFADVAAAAGVAHPGWGMGVCTADVDGDGREDVYVTAYGPNRFYRNRGDGTFEEMAERAGVAAGGWSTGCGFADYDRDGDLDLFVSRYVAIDLGKLPEFGRGKNCEYRGVAVQCGPRGLPGESDLLFRNDGSLRFTEVSKAAGVADPERYFGLGVSWFDADDDGWIDLFVANDLTPNLFYRNRGDGTFAEEGFPQGVAVSEDGVEQGAMGVSVGDYDNDGRLDLFVTNFSEDYNALYSNQGGHFSDVSFRSASALPSLPYVGWGTAFVDVDNDGWQDLLVVNGHVYPQLTEARAGASAPYRQRKLFYRNRGDGTFEETAASFGEVLTAERVSRGLAIGDLDDDGRLDVVINDLDGPAQVLHNEEPRPGHWLAVKLVGRAPNTGAVGAVVTAKSGTLTQKRVVQSGSSYLSQHDKRLHFGLGSATRVERLTVRWPDGTLSELVDVEADRRITVEQEPPATAAVPPAAGREPR